MHWGSFGRSKDKRKMDLKTEGKSQNSKVKGRRGRFLLWGSAAVLLLLIFSYSLSLTPLRKLFMGSRRNAPEYVFSYAENQTSDYPTTQGARRFAELVKERSKGRIEIRVHPNAELGSENSVVEQLRFGGVDFARVSLSAVNPLSEKSTVLQMPYLYRDSEHMWKVLSGEIGREIMDSFRGSGIEPLSWYDAGVRNFYTVEKPIEKLEDMANLRIRVQESALMQDMVRALGALPIPLAYEDVYSALQTGEADGAENNWSSYETMQHDEVAKFFTLDEHMRVPEMQIISQVTWDRLSPEDREIIRDCAVESAVFEQRLWQSRTEEAEKRARAEGTVVIVLSAKEKARFRNAMAPLYEKYCGNYMDLIRKIEES